MPQMSPLHWTIVFILLLFLLVMITSTLSSHAVYSSNKKNMMNKQKDMKW